MGSQKNLVTEQPNNKIAQANQSTEYTTLTERKIKLSFQWMYIMLLKSSISKHDKKFSKNRYKKKFPQHRGKIIYIKSTTNLKTNGKKLKVFALRIVQSKGTHSL